MKMKKILALTLAVLMLASCIVGCNPSEDEPGNVEFNVGSLPIVNEKITLKVLTQDPTDKKYSSAGEAGYWKWLEEKTGIHFEVESYSKDELANKLPLIMSDPNQMPDLFIGCGFSEAMVVSYGAEGQLLKLNDLINQYGTNIKTMFEESDTALGASVLADGSIYALPTMNGSPNQVMYAINERFLDNCGLEVPTTLEELAAAMKTMKNMDANKNGIVGDELLWSCEPKSFKRQALSMVGIACYWPWQGVIVDDHDGEVYFVPTSDEYKYLLSVLHDLYTTGCIDQEIFTQDFAQVVDKRDRDLTFINEYVDDPELANFVGVDGWAYITNVTSAVHDTPVYPLASDYQVAIGAVSKFTKYPEICTLVLDYMYSEEASIVSKYGIEGTDYTVKTEDPWIIESISTDIVLGYGYTPFGAPSWIKSEMLMPKTTALQNQREEKKLESGRFAWQNYLHLTTEQSTTLNEINADLGLLCDDYWAGFITGTYDLDKDWDNYVRQCEQLRCDEAVEIYQDAYDVYFGQ